MTSSIEINVLAPEDFNQWKALASAYKEFYKTPTTDEEYITTWERLIANQETHGFSAKIDNNIVGITHFLFHPTIWAQQACYLQDLFTAPEVRGRGVARQLINAVADNAKQNNADRLYWLTQEDNDTARKLYDKVAKHHGFIRYDFAL